jgi:hypothetical protein
LWEKLSELTADRFGYMASPNLEKCVSCFFKLSSGLDTKWINFDYSAYLTENERILNYFKTEKGTNLLSHPINPMRIKAIELFSKSELYQNIINKQDKEEDKVLEEQIDTLTDILMVLSNSQIDRLRSYFIASAGIIVSGIDKQIDKEEIEKIIYELSYLSIFPKEFLSQIYESGKAEDIFKDTIQQILTINPSDRNIMFNYCIGIAIGDKRIAKEEIDFIFGLGKTHFGYEEKEAAQIISENIRDRFMPSLYT